MLSRISLALSAAAIVLAAGTASAATVNPAPLNEGTSTAAQVARTIPADIMGQARSRIETLLRHAAAAETAGDDVQARNWRGIALAEIATGVKASDMMAEAR